MEPIAATILDAVARGDHERAASLMMRELGPVLLGHAQVLVGPADADDLLQEAVLSLLAAIGKGRFRGQSSLRSYAVRTVRYLAFCERRSFWRRLLHRADHPGGEDDLPSPPPEVPPPWGDDDPDELVARLLALLDGRERVVITMRLEGTPFSTIARTLRISEATTRQTHGRALRRLRAAFIEDERGVAALRELPPAATGRRDR